MILIKSQLSTSFSPFSLRVFPPLLLFFTVDEMDMSWLSQVSMTASMQVAEECLKDTTDTKSLPDGLDSLAKTIESSK